MTDKEFKRLSRAQLIEIIYRLQLKEEELSAQNQQLKEALAEKRLRMDRVGNLAEAVLEINNVMQAAQDAAAQYIDEIRQMRSEMEEERRKVMEQARQEAAQQYAEDSRRLREEVEAQRQQVLEQARQEAAQAAQAAARQQEEELNKLRAEALEERRRILDAAIEEAADMAARTPDPVPSVSEEDELESILKEFSDPE